MEVIDGTNMAVRSLGVADPGVRSVAGEAELGLAAAQARRHRSALAQVAECFPGLDPVTLDAGHGLPSHHRRVAIDPGEAMAGIDEILSGQDLMGRVEGFHQGSQQAVGGIFTSDAAALLGPRIDPARFEEALASGLTIRINGVQPRLPPVGALCRQVSFAFATMPNANAYFSGSTAPGLSAHIDSHDVYLVQLAGSKGWQCARSPHIPQAGAGGDRPLEHVDWAGTVEAGDGLHLPRGTVHRPIPSGTLSVHVSVGARRPTWSDVLSWMGVENSDGVLGDVPAALACGVVASLEALGEEVVAATGRHVDPAAVAQALARYRFGLPTVRSASVGAVRVAMAMPATVSVRWCAPGGLCVAVDEGDTSGRRPNSTSDPLLVGAAGHVLAIGPGDVEPLSGLLEGDEITSASWGDHVVGERAVAMLSRLGLVEPVGFLE